VLTYPQRRRMTKHYQVWRLACLQEDEGRNFILASKLESMDAAEEFIKEWSNDFEYFKRGDFEIMEVTAVGPVKLQ
jgi:hypothetical protein